MLHPGLYEQVINNALNRELSEVPEARKSTAPIDTAEASKVLAQYLTEVVQKGLDNVHIIYCARCARIPLTPYPAVLCI